MRPGWLGLLALLVPLCAEAHSPIKGVMPFYGGVLHPFVVPAHVLAIIAIGLLVGRQGEAAQGRLLGSLFVSVVLGVATAGLFGDPDTDVPLLVTTCLTAVAVAWGRQWPAAAPVVLVGTGALLLGLGSAPEGVQGSARGLHLAGCCLGVMVGTSLLLLVADHVRQPWHRIALRVACSWIAATTLLVLALTVLRPGQLPRPDGIKKPVALAAGPIRCVPAAPQQDALDRYRT